MTTPPAGPIRPRDPHVRDATLTMGPYASADAARRLLDLCYRDCWSVLDLTYGNGRFWADPSPPGIVLATNDLDPASPAAEHRDFTATGLAGKAFDLVVFDPPHLADGGLHGIMANQFGSAKGTLGLRALIEAGMVEATRLARVGVLVKVTDHAHGGEWLPQSHWATYCYTPYGAHDLYCLLHTYRPSRLNDPKWRVQRVPRSVGATYLAFRQGRQHVDFDRLYHRAERAAARGAAHAGRPED